MAFSRSGAGHRHEHHGEGERRREERLLRQEGRAKSRPGAGRDGFTLGKTIGKPWEDGEIHRKNNRKMEKTKGLPSGKLP